MLAHLNSKKNSIFFNLKPTVIDKLISKNKSSIQDSYANEESDGSLSEDSDDSWSSSREIIEQPLEMAPVKRSDKVSVLGSKLSRVRSPIKTIREGTAKNLVVRRGKKPSQVKTAKKVVKSLNKDPKKQEENNGRSSVGVKRKVSASPDSDQVKRSRVPLKKTIPPPSPEKTPSNVSIESKPTVARSKPKISKEPKSTKGSESKSSTKHSNLSEINDIPSCTKGSPRKFPINTGDQWKSTGMVIRGRGRVRGHVVSRRGTRGRSNDAISSRSVRYVTRESQLMGLMRSGKRRKVSDGNLVEGLLDVVGKSKKRVLNKTKEDKNDFPSDEHSSFVTTSEHSFCDNDSSLKQIDYENTNIEQGETEDTRDTNCNVFGNDRKMTKTSSCSSDTNDARSLKRKYVFTLGQSRWFNRGRKRAQLLLGKETINVSQSDSSVKDSDCSLDSEVTGNMTMQTPDLKRKKRKVVDSWVRRSTRSIGKDDKPESEPIEVENVVISNNMTEDVDSNSKSSLNIDLYANDSVFNLVDGSNSCSNISPKITDEVTDVIKGTVNDKETVSASNFVLSCSENISVDKSFISNVTTNDKEIIVVGDEQNGDAEGESLETFSLVYEESPVKKEIVQSNREIMSTVSINLDFYQVDQTSVSDDKPEKTTETKEIAAIDQSVEKSPNKSSENSNCNNTKLSDFESNTFGNDFETPIIEEKRAYSSILLDKPFTETNKYVESSDSLIDSANKSNDLRDFSNKPDYNLAESITEEKGASSFTHLEKPCEKTNYSVVSADSLVDTGNKSNDEINKEILTDENILSMIDSFIQSDSSFHDENQQSGDSVNSNKMSIEYDCKTTEEVEKEIVRVCKEDLSITTEIISSDTIDQFLGDKKMIEISHENPSESDKSIKESNIEPSTIMDERIREEKIENITAPKNEPMMDLDEHNDAKEILNAVVKNESNFCESDNDVHKIVESSEESSSSDSNSNLFESLSAPLDNDTIGECVTRDADRNMNHDKLDILVSQEKGFQDIQSQSEQSSRDSSTQSKQDKNDISGCSTEHKPKQSDARDEDRGPSEELLSALGLQSLQNITEEKPKRPTDNYTGTLKAVIKLNRSDKRSGGRKMIFKQGDSLAPDSLGGGDRLEYRICNTETFSTEGVPLTHLADIPANRKTQMKVKSQFDLSSSPNIIGTAGSSTEGSSDSNKESGKQALVIPEKSSSFSIHPERLCTDVCAYCFGKFGSLDTPCHLAQLKNSERQSKILAIEVHLSVDSCLCDGCFRYVDRKANCPGSGAAQRARQPRRGALSGAVCVVHNCGQPARHSVRRKWLVKLKKSIGKKLDIDMDKNVSHLPFPLCSAHYYWVDYFTVCGICKKRLTRNHMYALGPEAEELNRALSDDGIPVRLSDKLFLCKLCRYYGSLRLKYRDPATMSSTHRLFLNSYRRKILHYHDMPVSESEEEEKPAEEERERDESNTVEVMKSKKKKSKNKSLNGLEAKKKSSEKEKSEMGGEEQSNDSQMIDYSYLDKLNVHREGSAVEYNNLPDFNGPVGFSNIASLLNPLEGGKGTVYPQTDAQNRQRAEKPTRIQVKFGNLNIGKLSNLNIGQDTRPASGAGPATERPPFLPGERELNLSGEFEFHGTARSNWERVTSTVQFDQATKKLWQELQRPYGNQSSFLRHLVILEKHWRSGSLTFTPDASPRAVKYLNSVQNRVSAYDAKPSAAGGADRPKAPTDWPRASETSTSTTPLTLPARPPSAPVRVTSAPPPLMRLTPRLTEQLRRPPPPYAAATQTSARVGAPPPYRLPAGLPIRLPPRPSSAVSPALRLPLSHPASSVSPALHSRVSPSMSYQQFRKIRLEPAPMSAVRAMPPGQPGEFVPLICDVRSLAQKKEDWSESFRKQQQQLLKQNVAKYYFAPKSGPAVTVTQYPNSAELVVKTTSLTIEKAPSASAQKSAPAPPEKPSISVFREPASGDNG